MSKPHAHRYDSRFRVLGWKRFATKLMRDANPNTIVTDITCDRDAASESINNTNPPNNRRHTIAVHGYPGIRTVVISSTLDVGATTSPQP